MLPHITERKMDVFVLLAEGHTNQEIADSLELTGPVIKNYVKDLLDIVGMTNRLELALWYVAHEKEIKERYGKKYKCFFGPDMSSLVCEGAD